MLSVVKKKIDFLDLPGSHHPLPSHTTTLVVGGASLGELEDDTAAGEPPVDLRVGVQPVVNATTLLLIEDDLEGLAAVLLSAEALADDLDRVDKVGQDGIVDSSQGPRARALLLLGVAGAAGALGSGEDAARGQDQDVAVRKLLLELTGEARQISSVFAGLASRRKGLVLPLLDAVEALQGRDGDKDDNSLLAVANLDLIKIQSQHASSRMDTSLDRFPSYSTILFV